MFLPVFHAHTLPFQTSHGHTLGQFLLDADIKNEGGQHHKHQSSVENTVFGLGLLGLHQIQQPHRESAGPFGGAHKGHGDDVLIPEREKIKEDDGDDGGLRHGKDDFDHGFAVARAVDIRGLLKIVGQSGKIT